MKGIIKEESSASRKERLEKLSLIIMLMLYS